ncbi:MULTISPECIES: hypothetical protein [Pseudomonas]|uniref:Uncharacterized protein n=1 Tax=Pseudomonas salomonii TaxID=191391 RepID=A0A7Y8GBL5_9PSED|nr:MULTISPECIES: hypothetical protein [Pseudomonas]NWF07181.1 hypothetical protein [Pseudomonas salomonii]
MNQVIVRIECFDENGDRADALDLRRGFSIGHCRALGTHARSGRNIVRMLQSGRTLAGRE